LFATSPPAAAVSAAAAVVSAAAFESAAAVVEVLLDDPPQAVRDAPMTTANAMLANFLSTINQILPFSGVRFPRLAKNDFLIDKSVISCRLHNPKEEKIAVPMQIRQAKFYRIPIGTAFFCKIMRSVTNLSSPGLILIAYRTDLIL
jgi:hypothetical protein